MAVTRRHHVEGIVMPLAHNRFRVYFFVKVPLWSGFFLPHFSKHIAPHLSRLIEMLEARKIESVCDASHFSGIHNVASAVEHLYTGRSLGKVIVELP